MGLRFFLFDTTAPQMLYTDLDILHTLQRQRREPGRKRAMMLDLHIHTSWNSADSNLSPIELIREAKRLGLDGVVVTEHDRGWDRFRARELAAEHDFLFLRGMEVSTDLGHILVCGLDEYVSGIQRAEKPWQVVDEVGGIMIAAHPFRRAFTPDFRNGKEPTPLTLAEAAKRSILVQEQHISSTV